jgi:tape measure domain-containing protein
MAKAIEAIKIKLELAAESGAQNVVNKLKSELKGLATQLSGTTNREITVLRRNILQVGRQSDNTVSSIRNQTNALRALRDEAVIGSTAFKKLTQDIKGLDAQMEKAQKAQGRKRLGARGIAQGVGAIAAGGVFGGPEGLLGGAAGLAFGGPAGAAVGAAIGAQVGGIRKTLGSTAEYAAELQKLRIALKGVTTSQAEYQKSLDLVNDASTRFAIPQEIVTEQFTKLQASVQGAGGNIGDTKTAFNGIVAAVRATGGSLEDIQSALRATSQVFSKGKVSAEELRQQIGERLPGSFTLFAEAIGKTPQELDKALEKGQVSLQDFQTFAKAIFDRYGKTAEIIAKSPAAAGDRLRVSISKLKESVGQLLAPIGSAFQETFGQIVDAITRASNALQDFLDTRRATEEVMAGLRGGKSRAQYGRLSSDEKISEEGRQALIQQRKEVIQLARANAVAVQQPEEGKGLPGITPPSDGDGDGDGKNFANALAQAQKLELRTAKTLELARAQGAIGRVLAQQANARATLEAQIGAILKKNSDQKVIDATNAAELNLKEAQRLQLNEQIEAITERAQQPLQSIVDSINKKVASEREYAALIKSGVNPEIAQQVVQINRAHEAGLKQLETRINEFEVAKQQRELTDFELQQLDDLIRKRRVLEGLKGEATTLAFGMPAKENTKLKDFIKQSEDQLKDLQQVAVNVSQGIGNALGNSLASGIEGLVAGTAKAKEVFANFLKDVGRVLIQEGAKMIATYIAIGVAKAFAGLAGGGGPDPNSANVGSVLESGGFTTGNLADAAAATPLANGGPAQAGRPYVVGERRPELFVPGATGRIDTNRDLSQMMGRSPVASSSPSMNFTFETTTIGGTEFVSREQLEDAMSMTRRQAAADGAKRGMGMTLDKIQNSPRTRSRIGIR